MKTSIKTIPILAISILLTACKLTPQSNNSLEIPVSHTSNPSTHTYEEISHLKIYWSDIFKQQQLDYFVYFYSETCSHCKSIKDQIIEYALCGKSNIYFVSASPEINMSEEPLMIDVDNCASLSIRGYPSLIQINNKIVVLNIAGIPLIKEALNIS